MPNIFDNITDETRLGLALRESLKDFDTVDVATGYLDLRGWSSFADIIEAKHSSTADLPVPAARVIVGMVAPSDSQEILESFTSSHVSVHEFLSGMIVSGEKLFPGSPLKSLGRQT